jgi:hypothetical protein
MYDLEIGPLLAQVFDNQPAMAAMGFVLATEQTGFGQGL